MNPQTFTPHPPAHNVPRMAPVDELAVFVERHRLHGTLTGDATPPTSRGYRVWVACSCGARLERWVTPEDAARELLKVALASPNLGAYPRRPPRIPLRPQ